MIGFLKKLFQKKDPWIYGTCNGEKARKHKKSGRVESYYFVRHNMASYTEKWVSMNYWWWDQFVPDK